MEKKRVLISCNRTLGMGGIEKSITTFVNAFDTDRYDVTLVLNNRNGERNSELNLDNIRVVYVNDFDSSRLLKDDIRKFRILPVIRSFYYRMMLRITSDWYAKIMYTYKIIERAIVIPGRFDLAYSFTTDYSDLSIVLKADAGKRACMIHGDAGLNPNHAKMNDHLVRKLDRIFAVSEDAKKSFESVHPSSADKLFVFPNIIDSKKIRRQSEEGITDVIKDGTITLCTVGGIKQVKGQQLLPKTIALLKEEGIAVRWYLVGDGPGKSEVETLARQYGVEEQIVFLGIRKNPYPYMKCCDIYVQPSISEALCTTTMEAKILRKPIVTTDAPGMREQFVSGENGLIVDEMTPEALFEGIKTLLDHPEMQQKFIDNLSRETVDNSAELQKLYDFIEA